MQRLFAACVLVLSGAVHAAIYDGSQSNNVIEASVVGEKRATLSFRVQSPANENPIYVILAEYGQFRTNNSFRLTFNGRRERRICGFYGDVRVYSAPNVLDDGLLHHVALDIEPGRSMTLSVDGKKVDAASVPDRGFSHGPLAVAQRLVNSRAQFRGRIEDVELMAGGWTSSSAVSAPIAKPLTLPPDPYAMTPTWERPKTTRRYLHGPFAERLLTFWREGKIAFGEVNHRDDWSLDYFKDLHAHAAWLVHGANDEPFDFRSAEMTLPEGGEPDHAQKWRSDSLEVTLAACAPFGRKPSAFVRLTVRNTGDKRVTEPFAFLLREGLESKLIFGAPDVYKVFRPSTADWATISPKGWRRDGDVMRHGERFVVFGGAPFAWDAERGAARFAFDLKPGEVKSIELEIGKGKRQGIGYDAARKAMLADWAKELAKLKLPSSMSSLPCQSDGRARSPNAPQPARIVRNLAVQMLQCLSMPTEGDFVLPRQGGLQRYVWPGDADCFLEALDAIGYGEYVAKCIDFYYSHCQRANGEAGPFRNNWAGDTASVLKSFARHCTATGDAECWRRWREAAFKAFEWIESKRREGGGLFPSMKATDHPAVLRAWGSNDLKGLEAYVAFLAAAEKFGDSRTAEVKSAEASYRAALTKVMDVQRKKYAGKDEFEVPITADGCDDPFLEEFMFYLHSGRFAENGLLTTDEMTRLRTWLMRHGYANANGLYANQLSRNHERRNHIWYTTWTELQWFRAWRRGGRHDLAEQALGACLKYALTDELYVGERYHDANPWYYPWSPNASGSGRITMMLMEQAAGPDGRQPFAIMHNLASAPDIKAGARPTCIIHDGADAPSQSFSIDAYVQLRKLKVPAELHLFDGYRTNWTVCADEFLRQMNFDGRLGKEVKLMDRYDENSSRRRSEREDVWPDGKTPPGYTNQCVPYIEWHFPLVQKTRAIQIIFSGGGYHWNKPEGMEVAPARRYMNSKGMTVVTLKYRQPRPGGGLAKHVSAWQDLQRAIRIVRSKAAANGLDPERIGIMGGSAGGHLALLGAASSRTRSYQPIDAIDEIPCNVQWAIAVYPAYSLTDGVDCHNTNGGNGVEDRLVPEFAFDPDTCPVLFLHGDADVYSAMASVKAWEQLRKMGVRGEVHTFAKRPHCFQYKASPGTGSYTYLDKIWEFMDRKKYNAQ